MHDVTVGSFTLRYAIDRARLPAAVAEKVVWLEHDEPAAAFVRQSLAKPHGRLATVGYDLLRRALSDYDAYGLLGMYPMHLLSTPQLERLLAPLPARPRRLLDVGAGDGGVTAVARPLFDAITVTEASSVLRGKLRRQGHRVLPHDFERAPLPGESFDAIFCLNVLDRCARPRTLLAHLSSALAPAGRLLVAVPLPPRPHVHVGRHTVDPEELLPGAPDWEAGAGALIEALFVPAGLQLSALARVPYLCRGDARTALHVLDAALFVLGRAA
jgi:SAM-dependent methyltransferase